MYDTISFDKFRARVLEHGITDIKFDDDKTCMTYILNNGECYALCTEEICIWDYYCDGTAYALPEIRVYQMVEP